MTRLLHDLPLERAGIGGELPALIDRNATHDYQALARGIEELAATMYSLGCARHDRIAVYHSKKYETVVAMYGAMRAGCVFVPVNPLLKAAQVGHILQDCNVRVLVTSHDRIAALAEVLGHCPDLQHLILVGTAAAEIPPLPAGLAVAHWKELLEAGHPARYHRVIDMDMAAIFYTSGSTGKPKGVVLSHRNMVTGAESVARYLENRPEDRLLAVLPFSFDYGFSQLSTAFAVGASVVLMDYLFPRDIVDLMTRESITGAGPLPNL